MKLRGRKNLVLRLGAKQFRALSGKSFTFQIPPDVAAIGIQYGSVEFRSILDEDRPGIKRSILDYDPDVVEFNVLEIQRRPNTGHNFLTIAAIA